MFRAFRVDATVTMKIPQGVDVSNRRAVRDWLNGPFFYHETNYSVAGDELKARVTYDLNLDLNLIPPADLATQLDALHELAVQTMSSELKPGLVGIDQLDVIVTESPYT